MGFQTVTDLDAETTISLGGYNKKTKRDNPTSVEGYYLGSRKVDSKKAKSGYCYIYYFQTPKGNVGVWGKTDLDRKMQTVELGVMVRASFSKMVTTPNGEMYKYLVEFDNANSIPVSSLPVGEANDNANYSDSRDNDSIDSLEESSQDEEDVQQTAALLAAERQAKVQALLNSNKGKVSKG